VGHSGDLPYVFGNFHVPGNLTGDYGPADRALSATIQGYWTALASSGNPNKAGLPAWPAYDSRGRAYMAFTKDAGTEVRTAEREGFIGAFRQALTRSLDSPAAAAPTAPDAVRNAEKASSAR
jgi:carboxylesterase type B